MKAASEQWDALRNALHQLGDSGKVSERSPVDFCRIYDATTPTDDSHNCIGCNLKDLTEDIRDVIDLLLAQPNSGRSIRVAAQYRVAFGLLNTLWEQLCDCFVLIGLDQRYRTKEYFPTFIRLRRWTNFFKHPGPFAYLIHHPTFVQDGTSQAVEAKLAAKPPESLVLDDNYVMEYFSADSDEAKRTKHVGHLKQTTTAVVVLPDLCEVAEGLVRETKLALDLLCVDLFAEALRKRSTVESFYCQVDRYSERA